MSLGQTEDFCTSTSAGTIAFTFMCLVPFNIWQLCIECLDYPHFKIETEGPWKVKWLLKVIKIILKNGATVQTQIPWIPRPSLPGPGPRFSRIFVKQVSDLIIPTMETARQSFFLKTYLDHEIPILFVGPTGTGKSAITNNFLLHLPKNIYLPNFINFSARTSASQTQDIIMAKLDRRRKGLFGPPIGKKAVVFVGKA